MAIKVRDVMSPDVCVVGPEDTIRQAALSMGRIDAGIMPVADNDRLIGVITDRDIALRAVAAGRGPDAKVREIMTAEIKYCYDDEDVGHVSENMAELQVRRLPVVDRDKRLVGILALSDLAIQAGTRPAAQALEGISQPGGRRSQRAA